jgi:hypothetical protein
MLSLTKDIATQESSRRWEEETKMRVLVKKARWVIGVEIEPSCVAVDLSEFFSVEWRG